MPSLQLNESMRVAVEIAQSLAKEYQNEYFYPAHLLRALLHKDVGLKSFLQAIGKDPGYILEWAEIRMEEHPKSSRVKELISGDDKVRALFEEAELLRIRMGQDSISPILVLAAIAKPGVAFSSDQLKSFPVKEKEILEDYIQTTEIQQALSANAPESKPAANGALFKYCIERTALAKEGKTDPIVGRDRETRMMLEILCRRTKPNVIITGEAGVGKTALIDGLALDIVQQKVPPQIAGSLLYELDLGALVAGASYKGEVEDRLKNIIKEIKQQPKALLFIDEIHILLDNKSGGIGSGAANLLKPELARGELTVIGATTTDEYRKFIETDQAFVRRFEVVQVAEPDEVSAEKMVRGLAPKFEEHHQLSIDKDAIGDCVRLSKRYLKGRRLPDAAIDLLDGTMAAIKLMVQTNKQELLELTNQFDTLKADAAGDDAEKMQEYQWLISVLHNKISPVLLGKLDDATQTDKLESAEELEQYLSRSLSELLRHADDGKANVSREDIAAVVSYKTGIPMGKIQAQEQEKLLHMDAFLKRRVVGQDYAVKALCDAILESRSGLNKKGQPIGSFFFLGPTGTGKTELAKSLAEFLFLDEKAMIRFDMSEFKEEHSAALLYGAPPGYVGYEEGGMLVNKIRQKPYSVLLFDEIEKAHPSVFDTFLQILDEGHMHDRLGKEGDFSNALIIFTSNIGSEWIAEQFSADEVPSSAKLMELMARYFRPEFLARLTEIVPFSPIREDNIVRILEIQMRGLLEALDKQGINLHVSEEAKKYLALNGFTPRYGARQISGVIRNQLRRPISKYIVAGTLRKGSTVRVQLEQETLSWNIE
ncbi:ATP-dependent Clp protease ATP-binding subunit ClpA [Cnuella takakiae]|uniref:ATP-dependent Clp protease ATP-binding subunit ClpA n=1 Tax=Cnuella takakiae TaxID=1302690 RepID=A0A1M4S9H6_9BACT|nr:ATP-dependent Clp protease ATP-binding subunit [Cnuella takakiae]OLY94432.1 type VI secretion system ATPase ClpV [Cnuella takakiae]SHE28883.1 ATP-dependent Clp protease ATP-binding subunit ClpA [Cnuella takakiae]